VPFDADTPLAVIHKHINEPLLPPREIRADIPAPLENIILKALAKEPKDRFNTASQMARAFDEFDMGISKPFPDLQAAQTDSTQPETIPDIHAKPTAAMDAEAEPDREPTLSSKTTVAMEPDDEDIAEKATVAMEADEALEPEARPSSRPAKAIAAEKEPASKAVAGSQPKPLPRKKTKPKTSRLVKVVLLLVAVGAVLAGLLLAWGVPRLFAEDRIECASIEACESFAEELWRGGDVEGALVAYDIALTHVPEHEHPIHAYLWCQIGEAHDALGEIDPAIGAFEMCIVWTEGDPALEDLRMYAEEQIMRIQGQ
jgi:hypothetical protein